MNSSPNARLRRCFLSRHHLVDLPLVLAEPACCTPKTNLSVRKSAALLLYRTVPFEPLLYAFLYALQGLLGLCLIERNGFLGREELIEILGPHGEWWPALGVR